MLQTYTDKAAGEREEGSIRPEIRDRKRLEGIALTDVLLQLQLKVGFGQLVVRDLVMGAKLSSAGLGGTGTLAALRRIAMRH